MGERVVILGAGGHGRDTLDVFEACNELEPGRYDVLGFVSEVDADQGRTIHGLPVLGGWEWFDDRRDVAVVCAVGSPAVRRRMVARAKARGLRFCTVVHPSAVITPRVRLGEGVIVSAGVLTTNSIEIGDHVILNLAVSIAHDGRLADFATLAPGVRLSGNVTLGEGCDLGTGVVLLPKVKVGAWSVVGAGAVVTADVPANATAVGVPARVIKTRAEGWWEAV